MKVKKKDKVDSVPKFNSHSGFSRENWNKLNSGKVVDVEMIPEVAKDYVEEVKKGK